MKKTVNYVEHGGELSQPAPVIYEGGYFYNFILSADMEKLTALCNRIFNQTSDQEVLYYPLTHHVMLTLGHAPKVYSGSKNQGWHSEKQMTIWLLLGKVKKEGDSHLVERPVLFPLYTCVPEISSLISGREVFGSFKSYGWLNVSEDETRLNPDTLGIDIYGFKEFSPENQAKRWALLRLERLGFRTDTALHTWTALADLFTEHIQTHIWEDAADIPLKNVEFADNLFEDFLTQAIPLVYLKQFRSAAEQNGAAYQAILEAPATIKSIKIESMSKYYVDIVEELASYPLAEELGISSQKAVAAAKVTMDFEIGAGQLVWEAFGK